MKVICIKNYSTSKIFLKGKIFDTNDEYYNTDKWHNIPKGTHYIFTGLTYDKTIDNIKQTRTFYKEEFEEYFMTLAEYRDKQINDILNDD